MEPNIKCLQIQLKGRMQVTLKYLVQGIEYIIWHVILDHPLGDQDLVEALVVWQHCPEHGFYFPVDFVNQSISLTTSWLNYLQQSTVVMLKKALCLVRRSHMTLIIKSESFILAQHGFATLNFVYDIGYWFIVLSYLPSGDYYSKTTLKLFNAYFTPQ